MAALALTTRRPLVSTKWLRQQLGSPGLVVYDATWLGPWQKPGSKAPDPKEVVRIPDARFFDIDAVADTSTGLPHMLPAPRVFERKMASDGVRNDHHVVVYDSLGIFSAARLYWTFHVFGHENVSVLDGGLPDWLDSGFPVDNKDSPQLVHGFSTYKARYQAHLVRSFADVMNTVEGRGRYSSSVVLDARSKGRFDGVEPEPRPIPSGHMPNSVNVPFTAVLDESKRHMLSAEQLMHVFTKAGVDLERPLVTSCGSGVTAAILYLALQVVNARDVSLYDGSWAEYAQRSKVIQPPPTTTTVGR